MQRDGKIKQDEEIAFIKAPLSPFLRHLGVANIQIADGSTRLEWRFDPELHANGLRVAHGGAIATLLDAAMGYAASCAGGTLGAVSTISLTTQFLAALDGTVSVSGRVTRAGRSVVFCEADIRSSEGDLIAHGVGSFKRLTARASGFSEAVR